MIKPAPLPVASLAEDSLNGKQNLGVLQSVQKDGYAILNGFEPNRLTESLLGLIGDPVALGSEGPIHQLRPRRVEEAPLNTYSGNYGLGEFPLHTDLAHWFLPPRYFLLRCVVGFGNIPTVLVDGFPLVKQVGTTALTRALMQPRRPVNGKRSLLRLFQMAGSAASLIRWDEKYIQPATKAGASGASRFSKVLAVAPRILASLSQSGDTIVIDNWRMLHGRAAVPESCLSRIIDRVYLRSLHP
jgi:L-asparagine oxygenase